MHINKLELLEVIKALKVFEVMISGKVVLVAMNNTTMMCHITKGQNAFCVSFPGGGSFLGMVPPTSTCHHYCFAPCTVVDWGGD